MTIQRITTIINLVLLTLGAYLAVSLFYKVAILQVQPPLPAVSASADAPGSPSAAPNHPLGYYNPISERDLFKTIKTAQAEAPPSTVDLEALEETKLQLKLWGTVSGDSESTYAVIEDTRKREQNLYRVGDSIQNATIKMILREKIVLAVEGTDEVLAMEEVGTSGGPAMMAARGRPMPIEVATAEPSMDQRISLQRAMIEDAFQDVNKLMTEVAITPHMQDGRPEGLALNNIRPNSIFRRMGLRNGDILVGVNGAEIQSVEDAMQLYTNLRSSSEVQLQIRRRGQDRNIVYNLR